MKHIDPKRKFYSHLLTREHCIPFQVNDPPIFKDLRILTSNRQTKDILMVDNKESVCLLSLFNIIPIPDFNPLEKNALKDEWLDELRLYLISIRNAADFRDIIKRDFM